MKNMCIYIYMHDQIVIVYISRHYQNIYVYVVLLFWRSFSVQLEGCIKLSVHAAADYAPESHYIYIHIYN